MLNFSELLLFNRLAFSLSHAPCLRELVHMLPPQSGQAFPRSAHLYHLRSFEKTCRCRNCDNPQLIAAVVQYENPYISIPFLGEYDNPSYVYTAVKETLHIGVKEMLEMLPKKTKPDYESFYTDNYDRVLHYVQGKLRSNEDAEDLTSEVFLYCYRNFESYDPEKGSITTWLYLIVNSRLKNRYRDHVFYVDFETISETMHDQNIDLDEGVYIEQLHNALMQAIRSLPERQQSIVKMRYFQNYSSDEIGKTLGISPGNVRVLLSRALNKLAASNEQYWKEFKNHG